eukprot:Phypoly_transcript_06839.p2 GENE.Phypoly_transcript_06839~~Phypoly_transcript_06839.p2  ORF type:complete len:179 (+),score=29.71 Phypoly_transcript_06839:1135-1671(+)
MNQLVWVDLEMTGLEVDHDTILEMACIITDSELNIIAEGPDMCIHHSDEALDKMNDWCKVNHAKSGLTARVKATVHTLDEVEQTMLEFVKNYVPSPRVAPLAGNSIHVDRMFLSKYMPKFTEYLHYRIVDVSTVKELCRRWYPSQFSNAPPKENKHRALEDIKESIEEMKFYKSAIFK